MEDQALFSPTPIIGQLIQRVQSRLYCSSINLTTDQRQYTDTRQAHYICLEQALEDYDKQHLCAP
jgi:hypothetical protein